MKFAAIKMDLHKANNEATNGAMMLNMARGLIEASQGLYVNGGDQAEVLRLQAEANDYLESAIRHFKEAVDRSGWAGLALETNANNPGFVD